MNLKLFFQLLFFEHGYLTWYLFPRNEILPSFVHNIPLEISHLGFSLNFMRKKRETCCDSFKVNFLDLIKQELYVLNRKSEKASLQKGF